jgi:spore germination protein GerM
MPAATPEVALPEPGAPVQAGLRTREVQLFFARADASGLAAQAATIYETRALLDQMKQTVVALVRGPTGDTELLPVLPADTPLRDLFLDEAGVLYLDLGQELVRGLPAGSAAELLAVGSLANTLSRNFPEVRSIRILIDGEEVNTLGGHLDLTQPLEPDPALILPEKE